jgi:O-antigen/teichoic acid export membrane protein
MNTRPRDIESGPPDRPLSRSGVWNLGLNVFSKSQTVALLVAGSLIDGFEGIGVIVTAMGACYVGGALADVGLAAELSRLSIANRSRGALDRSLRAIATQAPLAILFSPVIFYAVLGHRTGASFILLLTIGMLAASLAASVQLTAVLNGLGDFRTPAAWLGGARLLSSVVAIAAVEIEPTASVVLGSFAVAEILGFSALLLATRKLRPRLPEATEPAVIHRSHLWLGGAAVVNVLTRQSDTILVAWILPPDQLGLYATASENVLTPLTRALAVATPFTFRSIRTTLDGDVPGGRRMFRRALTIGLVGAALLAAVTFGLTQLLGGSIGELSGLSDGDGPAVLGLCLAAGAFSVGAQVCFWIGIGFARHRAVGVGQVVGGLLGSVLIMVAAGAGGVIAAAAASIGRDAILFAIARTVTSPPAPGEAPSDRSDLELELEIELNAAEVE